MNDSSLRRIMAIARHDLRILKRDPVFLLIFTIMPLGFMAFTKGAFGAAMSIRYPGQTVNGAAQVVPGAAVLFSGFLVGNLGFAGKVPRHWADARYSTDTSLPGRRASGGQRWRVCDVKQLGRIDGGVGCER